MATKNLHETRPYDFNEGDRVVDAMNREGEITRVIWWMDNSVDIYIKWDDAKGPEKLMVKYPSGDACF